MKVQNNLETVLPDLSGIPLPALTLEGITLPDVSESYKATSSEAVEKLILGELCALWQEGIGAERVQVLLLAMKEGRLCGTDYATCIYGHLANNDSNKAAALQGRVIARTPSLLGYSILEFIAISVTPEQTPEDNSELSLLVQIFERFLAALPTESEQAEQDDVPMFGTNALPHSTEPFEPYYVLEGADLDGCFEDL